MAKKTESNKIEKEAQSLVEKILRLLGAEAKVAVVADTELIKIEIDGENLGLLIGYRGENLESLQLLLGIILNKRLGEGAGRPVLVDVGGWRKSREESLQILVEKELAKLSKGRSYVDLPPMPPSQRRAVHILVGQHDGLVSESVGEEPNRHVVIKKAEEGKNEGK
jgi:spoIIIJ-associated protein